MGEQISAQKAICDALIEYLESKLGTAVKRYLSEFPSGERLDLPAISVLVATETLDPSSGIASELSDPDPVTGVITESTIVGTLEAQLQLDIFAPSKRGRSVLQQIIVGLLNPDMDAGSGLKIPMPAYYNQVATYVLTGGGALDDGLAAQTNEWRCRMMITADCDVIAGNLVTLMTDIELMGQIQDLDGSHESDFTEEVT